MWGMTNAELVPDVDFFVSRRKRREETQKYASDTNRISCEREQDEASVQRGVWGPAGTEGGWAHLRIFVYPSACFPLIPGITGRLGFDGGEGGEGERGGGGQGAGGPRLRRRMV